MPRFSLRTLMVVMLLGGPVTTAIWALWAIDAERFWILVFVIGYPLGILAGVFAASAVVAVVSRKIRARVSRDKPVAKD
jgi:hypothetical protein